MQHPDQEDFNTWTPEHPPTSNVPPRRARARSEKANGVTSGSSEESDSEPQTSRMAWFQALKKWFETPTKSEEESPSHGTFKRQRLFWKTSSQSATDCPSKEYRTPGPPEDWMAQPLKVTEQDHQAKKTSHSVDIVHRLLMGSKVKVIQMATRRHSGLTVQWGPMFFVSFSWNLYY